MMGIDVYIFGKTKAQMKRGAKKVPETTTKHLSKSGADRCSLGTFVLQL